MPRQKSDAPAYRYHISGQGRATHDGRDFLLGEFDSPQSKAKYYALLAEYNANDKKMPDDAVVHHAATPATVRCVTAEPRYTSLVAADGKVFYAFDGVLCFEATPANFRPLISVKADQQGRLNSEEHFRAALNMDELERTGEGQQQALKVWQENVGRHGPLDCASPAIADGKLYVRLKSKLACYDLRKPEEER